MKRLNQATSLFFVWISILIITSSLKLGVGSIQDPGPGFLGFLSSILLLCLSLAIFIEETLKSAKEKGERRFGWENLSKPFVLMVALCVYAFFLDTLGFLLSSFLLMWIMLLIDSPRKWYSHGLVAFIIVNVSYLVLCKWLRVLLPAGIFRIQW
jgi:putative tricarboxylic transport membrane protein